MSTPKTNERELVRASDIGLWAYCHRAWWLARVQHVPHQNPQVLAYGAEQHAAHGVHTRRVQLAQRAGLWLMVAALLMLLALFAARGLWG